MLYLQKVLVYSLFKTYSDSRFLLGARATGVLDNKPFMLKNLIYNNLQSMNLSSRIKLTSMLVIHVWKRAVA